ncbi:hypothetical protein BGW38_004149 [Lunasporangiospora selenospora]|uniref:Ubiquitin carboxyl-terminal hydrolase n=1 Tax=Lunasporangiospora selenospora TaxID=979761 RepID=A0A9P6KC80_9FUNG|nr:hypothetical protein BGW38_004149 [Lunasporangiospora selenospora]
MSDSGNWCLIESDPGVFTGIIKGIGVSGVQVEEIYSIDRDTLADLKPIHGLIFLFKYEGRGPESAGVGVSQAPIDYREDIFFAQQVINNACATQAILSILLNSQKIDLGEELTNFKTFVSDFPPELKGYAITNSEVIRIVHNSFARSDPFINDIQDPSAQDDDLFHFIAYTPINGNLYELDGLQEGPRNHGPCGEGEDAWLEKVGPIIQARMDQYASSGEIRFNLMAVVDDRLDVYEDKVLQYTVQLEELRENEGPDAGSWLVAELDNLTGDIRKEQEKRKKQQRENVLRKHNFVPMIYEILKGLAKENRLSALVEEGRERARADAEVVRQRRAAAGEAEEGSYYYFDDN